MMKAATNNDLQRAAASIEDGLKCNTCKKQFKDMNEIRKHRKAEHPPPPPTNHAGTSLAPLRYQPVRLVPPGEALKAGVEDTNITFLYYMIGWCFMTKYTFAHRVLNTV